jgi:hypothetical protein
MCFGRRPKPKHPETVFPLARHRPEMSLRHLSSDANGRAIIPEE